MSVAFSGQQFPDTQSLNIPGPITVTKNKSILVAMCWLRLARLPVLDDMNFLVYSDGASPTSIRYKLKMRLGDPAGSVTVGGQAVDGEGLKFFVSSGSLVVPGVWVHVAGVLDYNTSKAYVYKNGVLFDSGKVNGTFAAGSTSNTNSLGGTIGAHLDGDSEALEGIIEDVRLYSNVHSPNQIQTIATLHGKDSVVLNLGHRFPLTDRSTGTVSRAANIAPSERIMASGQRSPTWEQDVITSLQKKPLRKFGR
jgi:hypothetical protein